MGFQQHAAGVFHRGPHAQAGHAGQRPAAQAMHLDHEDAHRRRLGMAEAQIQRAKAVAPQRAAQLAAVHHMAADAVGPPQQRGGTRHVAGGQRLAHGRAGHAQAVHLVAEHARHVEALALAGGVQHGVVAGAARAEAEVVTHQHIAHAQAAHQHLVDEILSGLSWPVAR
jgi:hypothetical protein